MTINDLRFILAVPFGLLAEFFAILCIHISDGECNVDFNYIADRRRTAKENK